MSFNKQEQKPSATQQRDQQSARKEQQPRKVDKKDGPEIEAGKSHEEGKESRRGSC